MSRSNFLFVTILISMLCVMPQAYGMDAPPVQPPQNQAQAQIQSPPVYVSMPVWLVVMGDIQNLERYLREQAQEGTSAADIINNLYESNMVVGTLLHFGVWNGHENMVEFLLTQGALIDGRDTSGRYDEEGFTPLHLACKRGNKNIVKLLLDKGAQIDAATLVKKLMPIHLACFHGHTKVVKELLKRGVSVNVGAELGKTPLYYACLLNRNVETVKFLLEQSANVYCTEDKRSCLHVAAASGHLTVMEVLFNIGIPVDIEDGCNSTPLMYACLDGDSHDAAKLLIQHHANVNHQASDGFTALHYASQRGNLRTVQLLVDNLASVIAETKEYKQTPLHQACKHGQTKVIEFLLKHGANVNAQGIDIGETPLALACWHGSLENVKLLIQNKAIINKYVWNTAVVGNHPSIIWYFINTCNFDIRKSLIFNTHANKDAQIKEYCDIICKGLRDLKHFALANLLESIWKEDNSHIITAIDDKCVICYDDVEENSLCVKLSCGHVFHEQCLKGVASKACPMCRQETNVDCEDPKLCKKLLVYKKAVKPASNSSSLSVPMMGEMDLDDTPNNQDSNSSNKRKRDDNDDEHQHKKQKTDEQQKI